MDHPDTSAQGFSRLPKYYWSTAKIDPSPIRLQVSEEQLEQSGFAGAILAHEGVDFSFVNSQVDVTVGPGGAKAFGDAGQPNDGGRIRGVVRLQIHG
jgi:hypothetical protein